jgi:PTH1 family peptidyl-tRNA hydrolase
VLSDFAKADQNWLDDVLRGMSDGAAYLADDEGPKFLNAVALRVNPPRPSTGTKGKPHTKTDIPTLKPIPKPAPQPAPKSDPDPMPEDTRSPFQKLADRFR